SFPTRRSSDLIFSLRAMRIQRLYSLLQTHVGRPQPLKRAVNEDQYDAVKRCQSWCRPGGDIRCVFVWWPSVTTIIISFALCYCFALEMAARSASSAPRPASFVLALGVTVKSTPYCLTREIRRLLVIPPRSPFWISSNVKGLAAVPAVVLPAVAVLWAVSGACQFASCFVIWPAFSICDKLAWASGLFWRAASLYQRAASR